MIRDGRGLGTVRARDRLAYAPVPLAGKIIQALQIHPQGPPRLPEPDPSVDVQELRIERMRALLGQESFMGEPIEELQARFGCRVPSIFDPDFEPAFQRLSNAILATLDTWQGAKRPCPESLLVT